MHFNNFPSVSVYGSGAQPYRPGEWGGPNSLARSSPAHQDQALRPSTTRSPWDWSLVPGITPALPSVLGSGVWFIAQGPGLPGSGNWQWGSSATAVPSPNFCNHGEAHKLDNTGPGAGSGSGIQFFRDWGALWPLETKPRIFFLKQPCFWINQ